MSDDIYINIDDEQPKPVDVVQVEFDKQDVYIDVQQDYAPVLAVNGQVGYVTLNPTDIGLNSNNVVYITGNQTISGIKTFVSRPNVNGTGILLSGELLNVATEWSQERTGGFYYESGTRVWAEGRIFECTSQTSSYPFSLGDYYFNTYFNNKPRFTGVDNDTAILYISDPGLNRPYAVWAISSSNSDDIYYDGLYLPNISVLPDWKLIGSGLKLETNVDTHAIKTKNVHGIADASLLVYKTGDQTISGIKTFASGIFAPNLVYITGAQTISGTKTFRYDQNQSFIVNNKNNNSSQGYININEYNAQWGYGSNSVVSNYFGNTVNGFLFLNNDLYSNSDLSARDLWINKIWDQEDTSSMLEMHSGSIILKPSNILGTGYVNIGDLPYGPFVELRVQGNAYARNLVYNTGNQTISGTKDFITRPTVNGVGVLLSGEASAGTFTNVIYTTGNQTISGIKTFASRPIVSGSGVLLNGEALPAKFIDFLTPTTITQSNDAVTQTIDIISPGVRLTRGNCCLLYNTLFENIGSQNPTNTEWNADGWSDLSNLSSRTYVSLIYVPPGGVKFGEWIIGKNLIMRDTSTNKYYKFIFNSWQAGAGNNANYRGFSYTRTEIVSYYEVSTSTNFTSRPTVNGTGVLLSGEASTVTLPTTILYTTGNQIKSGRLIIGDDATSIVDPNSTYTLSLQTNSPRTWLEILNNSGANKGVFFGIEGNDFEQYNWQGGDIKFFTSKNPSAGTERLRITKSGNVGIGTNSPSEKLEVSGNIKANNLVYNTGDQAISGNKDFYGDEIVFSGLNVIFADNTGISYGQWQFSNRPTVNGTGVLLSGEASAGTIANVVYTTGNQTISGIKTFVNQITASSGANIYFSGFTGSSVSGSHIGILISGLWNNTGQTYTGIRYNVTLDSGTSGLSPNATNSLLNLAVNNTGVFNVNSKGQVLINQLGNALSENTLDIRRGGTSIATLRDDGSFAALVTVGAGGSLGSPALVMTSNTVRVASNCNFGWTSSPDALNGTQDLFLNRDAANIMAQRNGLSAQQFRVYNYTGTNSGEFGKIRWSGNVLQIGTEKGGSGIARAIEFQTDGTTRMTIATGGQATISNGLVGTQLTVGSNVGNNNIVGISLGGLTNIGARMNFADFEIYNGTTPSLSNAYFSWRANRHWCASGVIIGWGAGATMQNDTPVFDLGLSRSASGVLAIGNSTSPNASGSIKALNAEFAGIVQFGGTTNAFPSIRSSGTNLQIRLADNSAYSTMDAQLRLQGTAPTTPTGSGIAGDMRYDDNYIYICTATNTWKRTPITGGW